MDLPDDDEPAYIALDGTQGRVIAVGEEGGALVVEEVGGGAAAEGAPGPAAGGGEGAAVASMRGGGSGEGMEVDGDDDAADADDDEEQRPAPTDMSTAAFRGHDDAVYSVGLHPTLPDLCASGGGDDRAFTWSAADGTRIQRLRAHTDSVICVAYSAAGDLLATAGMDGIVNIYSVDLAAAEALLSRATASAAAAAAVAAAASSESGTAAAIAMDADAGSGADADAAADEESGPHRFARALEGPSEELEFVRWHPRGAVLFGGAADATVWLWNAATGAVMAVFAGHSGSVSCGAFVAGGKLLATAGADGTALIWTPKQAGQAMHRFAGGALHGEGVPVTAMAAHAERPLLLMGGANGGVSVVHAETGRVLGAMTGAHAESVETVAFCPPAAGAGLDSAVLGASGSIDGTIRVWDLSHTPPATRVVLRHDDGVTRLCWHPRLPIIFAVSVVGTLGAWDARSGAPLERWTGHTDMLLQLACSSDGRCVVTASDDKTCRVFRNDYHA